ncbi:MAG: 50S ribosomal protein L31 [Nitrospinales bacterium]
MKPKIHPKYFEVTVKCACGHEITVGAASKNIQVEICSNCHPFYTGKQKLVDTAGRIDKFNRKFQKGLELKKKQSAAKAGKQNTPAPESPQEIPQETPAPQ